MTFNNLEKVLDSFNQEYEFAFEYNVFQLDDNLYAISVEDLAGWYNENWEEDKLAGIEDNSISKGIPKLSEDILKAIAKDLRKSKDDFSIDWDAPNVMMFYFVTD